MPAAFLFNADLCHVLRSSIENIDQKQTFGAPRKAPACTFNLKQGVCRTYSILWNTSRKMVTLSGHLKQCGLDGT